MNKMISSYSVTVFGNEEGHYKNRATITLSNQQVTGYVRFRDAGVALQKDYEAGGVVYTHLPIGMLRNVMDILRNEKPIYLHFNNAVGGYISTQAEPVGEGEQDRSDNE